LTDADLIAGADEVGYPVLVKPSAGGGGKGMRVVHEAAELRAALVSARREAASAFGDDTLFLERFVLNPRHIEVQVLADGYGNVIHLGEARMQSATASPEGHRRSALAAARPGDPGRASVPRPADTARSVDYTGGWHRRIHRLPRIGPTSSFFMEMNTRLQVEHPVTEMVTGIDLVELQVRIAAGEKLPIGQDDVTMSGHAIEGPGYMRRIPRARFPADRWARCWTSQSPRGPVSGWIPASRPGMVIGSEYDPMLAKVIAHAADRPAALRALDRALTDTTVLGITTNIEFLRFPAGRSRRHPPAVSTPDCWIAGHPTTFRRSTATPN